MKRRTARLRAVSNPQSFRPPEDSSVLSSVNIGCIHDTIRNKLIWQQPAERAFGICQYILHEHFKSR